LPPPFPRKRAELCSTAYRARTGRFFPEDDDPQRELSGPNLKANEFLNRRLTVEDAADAHVVALDRAPALGFEIFILSVPTPFVRSEAEVLKRAAADVIERHFPDAPALYARHGWRLPTSPTSPIRPSVAQFSQCK
jgi:nucleoside-diphosphate-sugar epimerase